MNCNSESVVQNCYFLFQGTRCPYCSVVEGYQLCVLLPTRHNVITRLIVNSSSGSSFPLQFNFNIHFLIYIDGYEDVAIRIEEILYFDEFHRSYPRMQALHEIRDDLLQRWKRDKWPLLLRWQLQRWVQFITTIKSKMFDIDVFSLVFCNESMIIAIIGTTIR